MTDADILRYDVLVFIMIPCISEHISPFISKGGCIGGETLSDIRQYRCKLCIWHGIFVMQNKRRHHRLKKGGYDSKKIQILTQVPMTVKSKLTRALLEEQ